MLRMEHMQKIVSLLPGSVCIARGSRGSYYKAVKQWKPDVCKFKGERTSHELIFVNLQKGKNVGRSLKQASC